VVAASAIVTSRGNDLVFSCSVMAVMSSAVKAKLGSLTDLFSRTNFGK